MAKEGSTIGGLMDSFGTAVSMSLQYGVPLEVYTKKFSHTRFEPWGYTKNPDIFLNSINNAGSIFLGPYSPEALGDYIAGPNHVLPTSGTAKFSSGLSVYDFLKRQSVIKISKRGIERLGPSVITLSKYENLHGHANSVKVRLKKR